MITLQQIKDDINAGKVRCIYYSAHTAWWTHLDSDVAEATRMGKEAARRRHEAYQSRSDVSQADKQRMAAWYEKARSIEISTDVTGAPLFMTDDVWKWIEQAEQNPEHYGKFGLDAFLKAHHQNCGGQAFRDWHSYSALISVGR